MSNRTIAAWVSGTIAATAIIFAMATAPTPAVADETCQSPYMAKITGQEEFVYVWTLGMSDVSTLGTH